MDILNWLYLVKNNFVRTTPSSDKDLLVLGAKVGFSKRGDKYQNYAMSVADLSTAAASNLGIESGLYVPEISLPGSAIVNVYGFYIKVGSIVQATFSFEFDGPVSGSIDLTATIPVLYDAVNETGFISANQARGTFMLYNPNPSHSSTENKVTSVIGRDEIRIQYNNGAHPIDAVTCSFMYEITGL